MLDFICYKEKLFLIIDAASSGERSVLFILM